MARRVVKLDEGPLAGTFGFDPSESASHFLVLIPAGVTQAVIISEHLSWDAEHVAESVHYGERLDGQVRSQLDRRKWDGIADAVRAELNARLKKEGKAPGRWRTGHNTVGRSLGKELTLLAWAIEDADPGLIPTAIANWQGLTPEERWWLYTMTAAATGSYTTGRGRGWRKAVRFALTENPATARPSAQPVVPAFFGRASMFALEPDQASGSVDLMTDEAGGFAAPHPDENGSVQRGVHHAKRGA